MLFVKSMVKTRVETLTKLESLKLSPPSIDLLKFVKKRYQRGTGDFSRLFFYMSDL